MNENARDRLYNLLPAILRLRDHNDDEVLRALMAILESEYQLTEEGITQLYENWFIETCAEDFVPYIGDLVGNRPLHNISQVGRKDVAKTIYYRRRKGTLAVLEELARDVTGWDAHAVEFFQLLGWTQHLNHHRFEMAANVDRRHPNAVTRVGTVNLRDPVILAKLHGAFDMTTHTVDVRYIKQENGWYNIRNVGIFLWRLFHYPLDDVNPRRATSVPHGYYFGSLGNPAPIFHKPHPEDDESGLASAVHVSSPIAPTEFYADLDAYRRRYSTLPLAERPTNSDYYGPDRGLMIYVDDMPIPPSQIVCKNLTNWEQPPSGLIAIDVALGRMSFATGEEPSNLRVDTTYGFSGDVGGGPYDRRDSMTDFDYVLTVQKGGTLTSIQQALSQWEADGKPDAVIRINDNANYAGTFIVDIPEGRTLVIEAANGKRPTVDIRTTSRFNAAVGGSSLILSGLLLIGALRFIAAMDLRIQHCTLVPGRNLNEAGFATNPSGDSLMFIGTEEPELRVCIEKSIVGSIRIPPFSGELILRDSIVHSPDPTVYAIAAVDDGTSPAPHTTIERCTILGMVYVRELEVATDSIITQRLRVVKRQQGCVRFSYVTSDSLVPRCYRCQPDLALVAEADKLGLTTPDDLSKIDRTRVLARVRPEFTAERYGEPGYAQLSLTCAEEIKQGAEDGAEMGVFNFLKQPQRLQNLRTRLDEYLVFGRVAGTIYIT